MPTRSPMLGLSVAAQPSRALFLSTPKCPACGREPAIVFHVIQSAGQQRALPAPCVWRCCPKVAASAKARSALTGGLAASSHVLMGVIGTAG